MNKKLIFLAVLVMVCSITAFAGGKKDSSGRSSSRGAVAGNEVDVTPVAVAWDEVPAKWQQTIEVWRSDDNFVISANAGVLTVSGNAQSFPNLNVRGGGKIANPYTPDTFRGEWAYLYSGDVKIGYIIDEVDFINGNFDLVIQVDVILGLNNAQEKLAEYKLRAENPMTSYEGIFNPDMDFSDIPDTIPNWEGRYTLEGHVFG